MAISGRSSGRHEAAFGAINDKLSQMVINFGQALTVASAFGGVISTFANLETQIVNTNTVAQGTAKDMKLINDAVRDFALVTTKSATESANALYFLASAGFTVKESLAAMQGVLLLSMATLSDVNEASDLLATSIRAFGLQAGDATRVSNLFVASISQSQASMDKLAFAFRQVAPVAGAMGISIEETVGALSQLFDVGLRGEQAGTALRNIMVSLIDPVGQAEEIFTQLGFSAKNADGSFKSLSDTLKGLADLNLSQGDMSRLFGREAVAGAQALLRTARSGRFDEFTKRITGTSEATRVAISQMQTFRATMERARNSVAEFATIVGEDLAPAIQAIADTFTEVTRTMRDMDGDTKRLLLTFAELGITIFAAQAAMGFLFSRSVPISRGLRQMGEAADSVGYNFQRMQRNIGAGNMARATISIQRMGQSMGSLAMSAAAVGSRFLGVASIFGTVALAGWEIYNAIKAINEAQLDDAGFENLDATFKDFSNSLKSSSRLFSVAKTSQEYVDNFDAINSAVKDGNDKLKLLNRGLDENRDRFLQANQQATILTTSFKRNVELIGEVLASQGQEGLQSFAKEKNPYGALFDMLLDARNADIPPEKRAKLNELITAFRSLLPEVQVELNKALVEGSEQAGKQFRGIGSAGAANRVATALRGEINSILQNDDLLPALVGEAKDRLKKDEERMKLAVQELDAFIGQGTGNIETFLTSFTDVIVKRASSQEAATKIEQALTDANSDTRKRLETVLKENLGKGNGLSGAGIINMMIDVLKSQGVITEAQASKVAIVDVIVDSAIRPLEQAYRAADIELQRKLSELANDPTRRANLERTVINTRLTDDLYDAIYKAFTQFKGQADTFGPNSPVYELLTGKSLLEAVQEASRDPSKLEALSRTIKERFGDINKYVDDTLKQVVAQGGNYNEDTLAQLRRALLAAFGVLPVLVDQAEADSRKNTLDLTNTLRQSARERARAFSDLRNDLQAQLADMVAQNNPANVAALIEQMEVNSMGTLREINNSVDDAVIGVLRSQLGREPTDAEIKLARAQFQPLVDQLTEQLQLSMSIARETIPARLEGEFFTFQNELQQKMQALVAKQRTVSIDLRDDFLNINPQFKREQIELAAQQEILDLQEQRRQASERQGPRMQEEINLIDQVIDKIKAARDAEIARVTDPREAALAYRQQLQETVDEYDRLNQLSSDFGAGVANAIRRIKLETLSGYQLGQEVANRVLDDGIALFEGLASGAIKNFDDIRQGASDLMSDLAAMFAKQAFLKLLTDLFGTTIFGIPVAGGSTGRVINAGRSTGGYITGRGYVDDNGKRRPVGETTEEAVLPLARTRDGRLGVQAFDGGGGTVVNYQPTITVNVSGAGATTGMSGAGNDKLGRELDRAVRGAVLETIQKEQRPGGALGGMRKL